MPEDRYSSRVARSTTQALLLRAVDFGESDRIVHLLTPGSGRMTAIAKGSRRSVKRFPGTLDLFNHLRVQIYRRRPDRMAHLEQATLISPMLGLRQVPLRFALGCYLLELFDRLTPEGLPPTEAAELFDFALSALRTLETCSPDARLRVLLELRTLEALGLRPELRCCVRCNQEPRGSTEVGFSVSDGGLVCGDCSVRSQASAMPLSVHLGTVRSLEQVLLLGLNRLDRISLSPQALKEASLVVARLVRFHVGIEMRSERFLNEILARGVSAVA